jgi:hypothetical protein
MPVPVFQGDPPRAGVSEEASWGNAAIMIKLKILTPEYVKAA